MRLLQNKPNQRVVIDFGFRDVGLRPQPVRSVVAFGAHMVAIFVGLIVAMFAICVVIAVTGVGRWAVPVFAFLLVAFLLWASFKSISSRPPTVVRVQEDGTNGTVWRIAVLTATMIAIAALTRDAFFIAIAVAMTILAGLIGKRRQVMPKVLQQVRAALAVNELVTGDASGVELAHRFRKDAGHMLVATDRRLLKIHITDPKLGSVEIESVAYNEIHSCHFSWARLGSAATVVLEFAAKDGLPADSLTLGYMVPLNAMSVIAALDEHGVICVGPSLDRDFALACASAPQEPAERQAPAAPPALGAPTPAEQLANAVREQPRRPILPDLEEARGSDFDLGLWTFVGTTGFFFYGYLLGLEVRAITGHDVAGLLIFPLICVLAGFLSRTIWSVLYIVPLCLMLVPAFASAPAAQVLQAMLVLSLVALLLLPIGVWLRTIVSRPAPTNASPGRS